MLYLLDSDSSLRLRLEYFQAGKDVMVTYRDRSQVSVKLGGVG